MLRTVLAASAAITLSFALAGAGAPVAAADDAASAEAHRLRERVDRYADSGSTWLSSRLQMFWNSRAADVYIRGEAYDHAGGDTMPAPTVMYNGARSHATKYARPTLEELTPYGSDDPRGMWLRNNSLAGKPYEWASHSATGNITASINNQICGLAKDAARLWSLTGDERYAEMAAEVFDTFLTGIYYRNVPVDLNHGHQQTLVGMTTFEVIHEDALDQITAMFPMLRPYLEKTRPGKMPIYEGALKKWADNIEANGVPHNNWNFMQARFILKVALCLSPDSAYADGKGRDHYIDLVLNRSSIRQWSLKDLAAAGYDPETGVWGECAGYSMVVLNDFTDMVDILDRELGIDLVAQLPVIAKAALTFPQYIMPDGRTIGFGDTHPDAIKGAIYERLVRNAQHFNRPQQEREFTALLNAVKGSLDRPEGLLPWQTSTFHAPNASWIVMRNGSDKQNSLSVALNGSEGNHMHANGISMELYGKGLRLGPDGGIGKTLYSGQDYLEYYSQFPAHNTVCVDGVSSYPVMKSNHPFRVMGLFPASGETAPGEVPVTLSDLYFLEPETTSDQRRQVAMVNTSDSTGYFVDIFRSRRRDGGDKTHDYFYHNMGQSMTLTAADGSPLALAPTEELAFAGAHLYAYSYLFDKESADTGSDIRADFTVEMPDGGTTAMAMWMRGNADRTVFRALSPMTEGLSRIPGMPYDIKEQPTLTYVARQRGEAWTNPFVALFEPSTSSNPGVVASVAYPAVESAAQSAVAVEVGLRDGSRHLVVSSDDPQQPSKVGDVEVAASWAIIAPDFCLISGGSRLKAPGLEVKTEKGQEADILLRRGADGRFRVERSSISPSKVKLKSR